MAIIAQLLVALASAQHASAHAVIIDSSPAMNETVRQGAIDIRLHYNSRIDHQRSRVTVIGPDGAGRPIAIASDSAADMIVGHAADLAPGQYRLRWQVLAVDGHLTRGDIFFSVKAP